MQVDNAFKVESQQILRDEIMPKYFRWYLNLLITLALTSSGAKAALDVCDKYDKILSSLTEERAETPQTAGISASAASIAFVHARVTSKTPDNKLQTTIVLEPLELLHPVDMKLALGKTVTILHHPGLSWCSGSRLKDLAVGSEYLFVAEIVENEVQLGKLAIIYHWNKSVSEIFQHLKKIQQTVKNKPSALTKVLTEEIKKSPSTAVSLVQFSGGLIPKAIARRFKATAFLGMNDPKSAYDAMTAPDEVPELTEIGFEDYFYTVLVAIHLKKSELILSNLDNFFDKLWKTGGDVQSHDKDFWNRLRIDPAFKILKGDPKLYAEFVGQWAVKRSCGLSPGELIKANPAVGPAGSERLGDFVRCSLINDKTEIWYSKLPASPSQQPELTKLISKPYPMIPGAGQAKDKILRITANLEFPVDGCRVRCDLPIPSKTILTFQFDCQSKSCKTTTTCNLKNSKAGFLQKLKHKVKNEISKRMSDSLSDDVEHEFLALLTGASDDFNSFKNKVNAHHAADQATSLSLEGYDQMYKDVRTHCKF